MNAIISSIATKRDASDATESTSQNHFISLGQAGQLVPSRPSANCLWRWCRKGVRARTGERVRLQHTRMGGRIFTTAKWVEEFGLRLAAADTAHFARGDTSVTLPSAVEADDLRRRHLEQIDRELDAAGI